MERIAEWALAVIVFMLCAACRPGDRGAITPQGYKNLDFKYQVVALQDGALMPGSWRLDNYYYKRKKLQPKDADGYVIEYELDSDGDGNYETKSKELVYDLRFKHLVHDGVIFLRTMPISTDMRHKKLSVLMDRYIEQIAGAGYEVVTLSPGSTVLLEKRYAAAVVEKGPAKLAGMEAFSAALDIANIDQIKIAPNARKERVELVLLHTNFRYKPNSVVGKKSKVTGTFPVVMFAGYANQPEDFEAGLADFHGLLNRIAVEGKQGFTSTTNPRPLVPSL